MQTEMIIPRHDSPSRITIDWSDEKELQTDALLEWLRLYPRKHDIHVYLPSLRKRHDHPRLQSTLQKLGCTVTARMCRV